jgi:hypothetical protein
MARKSQFNLIEALLSAMLLAFTLPQLAMGQSMAAQQPQASGGQVQPKPVSLAHLYWRFLVHQNQLDTKAASEEAQARNGSWLRNHHKASLGFSDAEYASIRLSSARLAAEMNDLDAQVAAIRAAGPSVTSQAQLEALTAQREAAINAEITFLKQALPPHKIAAFETYIIQFFSPKKVTVALPAPAAVQQ